MIRRPTRTLLVAAGLMALFLAPRLVGLDQFATVDEPAWLEFSGNFYHALAQRQLDRTVSDYHPAVTTMWLLTAAYVLYFPGYRSLAEKYYDKYWQFEALLDEHGKLPLTLLVIARTLSVVAISVLLTFAFFLLELLAGSGAALASILLVAFDPFFLGNSRLLNHEAFMASAILVSLLAALVYLYRDRRWFWLLLSGAAAGAALLTKSPAVLGMGVVGLAFAVRAWEQRRERAPARSLAGAAGRLAVWGLAIIAVYFIFWPGMWVNPAKMLTEVFGNALSYTFQGARLSVTQGLEVQRFGLETVGIGTYLNALWLKTTPVVWSGVLLALVGSVRRGPAGLAPLSRRVVVYCGLLAALFVMLFGMARGRNHMHYILTSYVALDVIAGVGLAWGAARLGERFPWWRQRPAQVGLLVAVLALHAGGGLLQYPYYYTYTNPVSQALQPGTQDPAAGYGEGLDLAARYLAGKPEAEQLKVMSWYAPGPFSYFFPGKWYYLLIDRYVAERSRAQLRDSDYLVIYPILQEELNLPETLLRELKPLKPEHTIWMNGLEYARIYKVGELPEELFAKLEE